MDRFPSGTFADFGPAATPPEPGIRVQLKAGEIYVLRLGMEQE